jgi:hypothetical protein
MDKRRYLDINYTKPDQDSLQSKAASLAFVSHHSPQLEHIVLKKLVSILYMPE